MKTAKKFIRTIIQVEETCIGDLKGIEKLPPDIRSNLVHIQAMISNHIEEIKEETKFQITLRRLKKKRKKSKRVKFQ